MRTVTETMAGDPSASDAAARTRISGYFDDLAPEWHTRSGPGRDIPLLDTFARGVPHALVGPAAEVGSGTGLSTVAVAERFTPLLSCELATEMLRLAPASPGKRVRADGACLPVADGGLAAVVLISMFLFGPECARVLRSDGAVVWVNSRGPETPIHLAAEAVLDALPGAWRGVAGTAGSGTWCVATRA